MAALAATEARVGIAQLRSLLRQPAVANVPERADAVLDLISVIQRATSADAADVVAHFCSLRAVAEDAFYLQFYRLRRWLESQVSVRLPDGEEVPLTLDFREFPRVVQHYRRFAWEHDPRHRAFDEVDVVFAWREDGAAEQ